MNSESNSGVRSDFDRLAVLDRESWTPNNHYHEFLLRHVPGECHNALEVGCGTGAFARRLAERAEHVVAIDLSPQMIRVARSHSPDNSNVQFEVADIEEYELPVAHFDCIVTIATLHHVPMRAVLLKLREALKPGGVLILLDLYEPSGWRDALLNVTAVGVSTGLRLIRNGRLRPPKEVRAAWEEHGQHDSYPTIDEIRELCPEMFPGATVRQHLLWRYSMIWKKP